MGSRGTGGAAAGLFGVWLAGVVRQPDDPTVLVVGPAARSCALTRNGKGTVSPVTRPPPKVSQSLNFGQLWPRRASRQFHSRRAAGRLRRRSNEIVSALFQIRHGRVNRFFYSSAAAARSVSLLSSVLFRYGWGGRLPLPSAGQDCCHAFAEEASGDVELG